MPKRVRSEGTHHGGGCNFGGHDLADVKEFRTMKRDKIGLTHTGNVGRSERKVEEEVMRNGSFRLNSRGV